MLDAVNVARWEWFKMQRRWMPWILLAVLVLFSQLVIWGNFFAYRNLKGSGGEITFGAAAQRLQQTVSCNDLRSGNLPEVLKNANQAIIQGLLAQCDRAQANLHMRLANRYANFTLPASVPNALESSLVFGVILVGILSASALGAEYGFGTLRSVLAMGVGRWQYLGGKLLLLLAMVISALVVLVTVVGVTSFIAGSMESTTPASGTVHASWYDGASALARLWLALAPYVALTLLATVITRSPASGMAIGMGYFFAEEIASAILQSLFDWFPDVQDYLLGGTISAWAGSHALQPNLASPSDAHAILVLFVYFLALCGLAFAVFQRRDVTGASGS